MVKFCGCVSYMGGRNGALYQDKRYGPGMRVHNLTGGKNVGKVRCTVCDKETNK